MKSKVYLIRANENYGKRRTIASFKKKSDAEKELKKLLSPGKKRKIKIHGKTKTIRLTSYRHGKSGTGINNPRIKKTMGYA